MNPLPYGIIAKYTDQDLYKIVRRIIEHIPYTFREVLEGWRLNLPRPNEFFDFLPNGVSTDELVQCAMAVILYHIFILQGNEESVERALPVPEQYERFSNIVGDAVIIRAEEMIEAESEGKSVMIADDDPALTSRIIRITVPYDEIFNNLTHGNQEYLRFLLDTSGNS